MSPPLAERNTGDIIPAADHNDVKDYIEDGTYRVKTAYLLTVPGSAPSAAKGIIYYDSGTDKFKQCTDGSNFTDLGGGYQPTYIVKTGGTVGVDCTHTTIAAAISDAQTGLKYIYIKNGTYAETLTINWADVSLVGESKAGVQIQPPSGHGINIRSTGITIKNLTVNNPTGGHVSFGIDCSTTSDFSNLLVENCVISGTFYACFEIVPNNIAVTNIKIINCTIQPEYLVDYAPGPEGIEMYSNGTATIRDVWFTNNKIITTGTFSGNAYGIAIFGYGSHVERIYVQNNTIKLDATVTKQIAFDFRTTNPAILSKIFIDCNTIDVTGSTDDYCMRLGVGTVDSILLINNYVKCDVGLVISKGAGTYTNIVDLWNILG